MILETSVDRSPMVSEPLDRAGVPMPGAVRLPGESATRQIARPWRRMAASLLVGIARYSFSLRLALHPHGRTLCHVQSRLPG